MTPDGISSLFSDSLNVAILMLLVLILPGLLVGVLVAMFQAATQINEASLSFIPKLLVTFLVMLLAGPWLSNLLVQYTQGLIRNIPYLIG
jgi:flagellar biosynthesis protein FliQ